jgi:hypothetical protein
MNREALRVGRLADGLGGGPMPRGTLRAQYRNCSFDRRLAVESHAADANAVLAIGRARGRGSLEFLGSDQIRAPVRCAARNGLTPTIRD